MTTSLTGSGDASTTVAEAVLAVIYKLAALHHCRKVKKEKSMQPSNRLQNCKMLKSGNEPS
jgi:hypothetical protein